MYSTQLRSVDRDAAIWRLRMIPYINVTNNTYIVKVALVDLFFKHATTHFERNARAMIREQCWGGRVRQPRNSSEVVIVRRIGVLTLCSALPLIIVASQSHLFSAVGWYVSVCLRVEGHTGAHHVKLLLTLLMRGALCMLYYPVYRLLQAAGGS
jgi:hypothetical protein